MPQSLRQYLRHPSDVPINFRLGEVVVHRTEYLRNIGKGGLCFMSRIAIAPGVRIHIEIPIAEPVFEAEGIVIWCRLREDVFEVGVRFEGVETAYSVRMVEQVCQIEHYRRQIFESEGRVLTSEEAGMEWIRKYASRFPR
jgi:hypothetical protein